ncbi:hypothetical protein EW145_g4298 [Phellinidium pouzarii]|uniref:Uncharacterized protein n=1 Tax=Phellinidium pouzarii TaxID=167371 RepID=A0A4S4L5G8_9AGAM|nr:hypothetical protein EW145_g4298 [Phellinidium pouzarii]
MRFLTPDIPFAQHDVYWATSEDCVLGISLLYYKSSSSFSLDIYFLALASSTKRHKRHAFCMFNSEGTRPDLTLLTLQQVNYINVALFTPALIFSKVAFTLSPEKLRELWVVPVFFILVSGVSWSISNLLGRLFCLKASQRNYAVAAAMFMNSNSLPIALMQSLIATVPGLKWGDDDTKSAMLGRALSYLVLFSTLGMVLRWSYGVSLLSKADPDAPEEQGIGMQVHDEEKQTPMQDASFTDAVSESIRDLDQRLKNVDTIGSYPTTTTTTLVGHEDDTHISTVDVVSESRRSLEIHLPQTLYPSLSILSTDQINKDEVSKDPSLSSPSLGPESEGEPLSSSTPPRLHYFHRASLRFLQFLKAGMLGFVAFMTAPLWASLLSLIVALVEPLQHLIENEIPPLKNAIEIAGLCSVPLTLIVLGGYFYTPPSASDSERVEEIQRAIPLGGDTSTIGRWRSFVRKAYNKLRSRMRRAKYKAPPLFKDPVFIVSNVLLLSSPTALTLAQMTQATSGDAFEQLISRTVFWSYCIVTPPTTVIYVLIGLILAQI